MPLVYCQIWSEYLREYSSLKSPLLILDANRRAVYVGIANKPQAIANIVTNAKSHLIENLGRMSSASTKTG